MRIRALTSFFFASAITSAAACSSVPDVTYSDDGGGSSSGFIDGGPDAPGDARADSIVPGCTPTGSEVCDDGIDNDCNGVLDCADPACAVGFICADAPPAGWSLVAFAESAPPECPTGYGAATDLKVVTGDGTGGSCACSCTPSGGAVAKCSDGKYTLGLGAPGVCGTTLVPMLTSNTNGTCTAFGAPPDITSVSGVIAAPAGPTTCTPNVVNNKVPLTTGRQCAAPPKVGKGCTGNAVCIPKPTGMQACVSKSGVDACPGTFPAQRRAGTSGTLDNRACNDCTGLCGAATPCTGTLTMYSNAMCNAGTTATLTLGSSCTALADFPGTGKANAYQATLSGGCGTAAGFNTGIVGNVAFENQETVCCK